MKGRDFASRRQRKSLGVRVQVCTPVRQRQWLQHKALTLDRVGMLLWFEYLSPRIHVLEAISKVVCQWYLKVGLFGGDWVIRALTSMN
jgi:hypothetical protein